MDTDLGLEHRNAFSIWTFTTTSKNEIDPYYFMHQRTSAHITICTQVLGTLYFMHKGAGLIIYHA